MAADVSLWQKRAATLVMLQQILFPSIHKGRTLQEEFIKVKFKACFSGRGPFKGSDSEKEMKGQNEQQKRNNLVFLICYFQMLFRWIVLCVLFLTTITIQRMVDIWLLLWAFGIFWQTVSDTKDEDLFHSYSPANTACVSLSSLHNIF